MDFLTIERIKAVGLAVVLSLIGILFIAVPSESFRVVEIIEACAAIVYGILLVVQFFVNIKMAPNSMLVEGILFIVLGILTLVFPIIMLSIILVAFCIVGIQHITLSTDLKYSGDAGWWKVLLYGIVQLALGIILLILIGAAPAIIMTITGILLILDAIFIIVFVFLLKHTINQIKNNN